MARLITMDDWAKSLSHYSLKHQGTLTCYISTAVTLRELWQHLPQVTSAVVVEMRQKLAFIVRELSFRCPGVRTDIIVDAPGNYAKVFVISHNDHVSVFAIE